MSNAQLSLGTLFTGAVDASFAKATARLKAVMRDLLKLQSRMATSGAGRGMQAFAGGISLADDNLSRLGKAMGQASTNGRKYEQTLANLTKHMDRNSLSIKDAESAMYRTDKVLRQLTRSYGTQLQQTAVATKNWGQFSDKWRTFKDVTDLNTVAQKVFNGQIQATEKGIKSYINRASGGTITFDKLAQAHKNVWPQIHQVNRAIDNGVMSWQKAAVAQAKWQAGLHKLDARKGAVTAITKEVQTAAKDSTVLAQALSRAGKHSTQYQESLRQLTRYMGENSTSIRDAERAVYKTDAVLRQLGRTYKTQVKKDLSAVNWGSFKTKMDEFRKASDLTTVAQKVLNGEVKGTEKGVKDYLKTVSNGRVTFDNFTSATKKAYPIINQVNRAIDAGAMSWQSAARDQARYQSAVGKSAAAAKVMNESFTRVMTGAKGMSGVWRVMNQQVDAGTRSWQNMARYQARWQTENVKALSGMRRYGDAVAQTSSVSQHAVRDTEKLSAAKTYLGKQISRVEGGWNRIKAAMKVTASYGLAATAIYGVVGALRKGVTEVIDFSQALKNLQAITTATDAQTAAMGDTVKKVAADTRYSAVEVAEGMRLIGQAGFSAEQSIGIIGATASLAAGTMEKMETTTDLMSTTLKAFNMEAIESSRVADVMANAVNMSKLTIDKLRTAFNYVGAASYQANISLEASAATMMALANNGLRASTIGTGFRQVLARLVAPSSKLREAYEGVGVSIDRINPLTVGWQEAVKNLSAALWDHEKRTVDMAKAYALFGLRGAQAAAVIAKSFQSGDFQRALDNAYRVGAAEDMAAKQAEGLGFKLKNLGDRAKNLAITMGEGGLTGVLGTFIDVGRALLLVLDAIGGTMGGQVILQTAAWTLAIYGVVKALIALKALAIGSAFINKLAFSFSVWSLAIGKVAAGLKILGFIIKAHPLMTLSTVVAAAGVALWRLLTAVDRSIEQHQKLAVEYRGVADSLEVYAGAFEEMSKKIKKGDDVSREYDATIQRLLRAHPEMTAVVQEHAGSIDELTAAIHRNAQAKSEIALEEEIQAIDKTRAYLEDLAIAYDNTTNNIANTRSQKEYTAAVEANIEAMRNNLDVSSKARKKFIELDETIFRVAASLAEWVHTGTKTEDEIVQFIATLSTNKIVVEQLTEAYRQALKARRDFAAGQMDEFEASLAALPKRFQATLDKLKSSDPLKGVMFLEEIKSMEGRIARFKQMAEKMKYSEEQVAAGLQSIYDTTFDAFFDKLGEVEAKRTQVEHSVIESINADIARAKGRFALLAHERDQDLEKVKGNAEAEAKVRMLYDQRVLQMRLDADQKMSEATADALRIKGNEIQALQTELEVLKKIREQRKQIWYEADNEDDARDALIAVLELDTQVYQHEKEILKQSFAERLAATKKFSQEYSAIMDQQLAQGIINITEWQRYQDDLAKYEIKLAEYKYKQKLISAEDYFAKLKELYQRGLIDAEDFEDLQHRLLDTPTERFTWGIEKARREAETWGDTMERIGTQLEDKIASNLTSAIFDFVDGTKSAKEAFADFAKDMIRWLGEIALKKALLKLLDFAFAGGSGGGEWGGTGYWDNFHTGGIVGKDRTIRSSALNPLAFTNARRYHSGGLAADEVPAILKKGEGVFTREQMKALGSLMKPPNNVFFFDKRLFDAYLATPEGQNSVVSVVGRNWGKLRRHAR